jgi:hypothetical protein
MGQTVDISEWLDFDFYDRVWYWDQPKTDMTNVQARERILLCLRYIGLRPDRVGSLRT